MKSKRILACEGVEEVVTESSPNQTPESNKYGMDRGIWSGTASISYSPLVKCCNHQLKLSPALANNSSVGDLDWIR